MRNNFLILAIFGILAVVAVSGCTSMNTGNTVTIQNNTFNPTALTVQAGTTVTWTNKDSKMHRVVSNSGLFDSGNLNTGMSYSYTFNKTGNYPYHDSTLTTMKGTIIVTPTTTNTTGSGGSGGIKY
jgi:plastocyanin